MSQLSLFSSARCDAPSDAHEVIYLDAAGVRLTDVAKAATIRVRLRLTGDHHDEPIAQGPLAYGECQDWEQPCKLYGCRYRLDDAVEIRTRRAWEPDEDHLDNPIEEYEGPRTVHGAYYSDAEILPGDWCALAVAERGGLALEELGVLFAMTREGVNKVLVHPALEAAGAADLELNDVFDELDGPIGRQHKFKFEVPDDNITSTEVKKLRVPGEVKRGKWVPTIKGRPRKKDGWAKVTHIVVPAQFADRVNERLMKPLRGPESIPEQFRKPLAPPGRKAA